jgi:hypothetical protein
MKSHASVCCWWLVAKWRYRSRTALGIQYFIAVHAGADVGHQAVVDARYE